jgi:uncharacterized RDD family membrane protein YckC
MVDTFALMLAVGTGILIAQSMAGNSTTDQVNPMLLMVMLAPMIMLTVVNWCMIAMDGQSVGKLLCRIKIVDLKGESPGFFQGVFMRYWVVGLLNMVPFFGLIDAFWIFSNDAKRCLHDYIAGTFVIDAK